ncbi:MAG: hypothetical protein KAT14_03605 [Candidatus Marinimicrobia bacterium]|nr:hypothetical protein [Candidatus Neomarinimicrobiota bacterium]
MRKWIKTKNKRPPEGMYVLGRHNRGTWKDSDDQKNVNCVIVKLKKGLSLAEREAMSECERKSTYTCDDEYGNNTAPYSFHTFGSAHFFGQSIYEWAYIP